MRHIPCDLIPLDQFDELYLFSLLSGCVYEPSIQAAARLQQPALPDIWKCWLLELGGICEPWTLCAWVLGHREWTKYVKKTTNYNVHIL